MELVVGVDMATAEVRAAAADATGRVRAQAHAPLPSTDASAWWPATAGVLADLTGRLGTDRDGVVALSVCATSGTVVALDTAGAPAGPALLYSDQRAVDEARVAQRAGADRWARLGLRVQPAFGLPKWAWLVRRGRVARLAHASDVVVSRLVGAPAPTDWSHAFKSGYDPERGEWAAEAMEALGIPLELLPEVRRPTEPVGRVCADVARSTGLPPTCEVRLGMTDACAAQLAAGAGTPGRFVSVLGTTLVLKGASCEPVADPAGAVYSHRHPDGWWLPGGASSTGAIALEEGFPGRDLAALDMAAARHGPAHAVVYPLTGRGERFPFAVPDAVGFSIGDLSDETERYRATLEGVAFVERLGYERLRSLGAEVEPPVIAAGGGSASQVWDRIRATVLNLPLRVARQATTALGACILAAAGTIHPDLTSASDQMVAAGEPVEPDGAERDALDRSYGRFLAAVTERGWLE